MQKFSSDGRFLGKWGSHRKADGQLAWLENIAVDGAGDVYMADHCNDRVQKLAVRPRQ